MGCSVVDLVWLLVIQVGYDLCCLLLLCDDLCRFVDDFGCDFCGVWFGWFGDYVGYLLMEEGVLEFCEVVLGDFVELGCEVEVCLLDYFLECLWCIWLVYCQWLVQGLFGEFYVDFVWCVWFKLEVQWEVEFGFGFGVIEVYCVLLDCSDWYWVLVCLFECYDFFLLFSVQVFFFDVEMVWLWQVVGWLMDIYYCWMEVVIGLILVGLLVISVLIGFGVVGLLMGLQIIGLVQVDLVVL